MSRNKQMDVLRASADIIEEVDGLVTYMGFCSPGTVNTSESKWSVLKITQNQAIYPILTSFAWANGACANNLVWDNRGSYTYQFKNF